MFISVIFTHKINVFAPFANVFGGIRHICLQQFSKQSPEPKMAEFQNVPQAHVCNLNQRRMILHLALIHSGIESTNSWQNGLAQTEGRTGFKSNLPTNRFFKPILKGALRFFSALSLTLLLNKTHSSKIAKFMSILRRKELPQVGWYRLAFRVSYYENEGVLQVGGKSIGNTDIKLNSSVYRVNNTVKTLLFSILLHAKIEAGSLSAKVAPQKFCTTSLMNLDKKKKLDVATSHIIL